MPHCWKSHVAAQLHLCCRMGVCGLKTLTYMYKLAGILFGAIGGKIKNRQIMSSRNTVSNSAIQ